MFPGAQHTALALVTCHETNCTTYVPWATVVQIGLCHSRHAIQLTSQVKRDHSLLYGLPTKTIVLSLFSNALPPLYVHKITSIVINDALVLIHLTQIPVEAIDVKYMDGHPDSLHSLSRVIFLLKSCATKGSAKSARTTCTMPLILSRGIRRYSFAKACCPSLRLRVIFLSKSCATKGNEKSARTMCTLPLMPLRGMRRYYFAKACCPSPAARFHRSRMHWRLL